MAKITILGSKGSGKTVFLSVLSKKYSGSGTDGICLKPTDKFTAKFTTSNWDLMNSSSEWPEETPDKLFRHYTWKLHAAGKFICDLEVSDYSGSVYEKAFMDGNLKDNDSAKLAEYAAEANAVILMLDPADVIGHPHDKAFNSSWAPKEAVDFLVKRKGRAAVAIVFTKTDRYRHLLEEHGSLQGIYKQYYPDLYSHYPKIRTFGISAVSEIDVDMDNAPLTKPSKGFKSEGLEEVMTWIKSRCNDAGNAVEKKSQPQAATGFVSGIINATSRFNKELKGCGGCGCFTALGLLLSAVLLINSGGNGDFIAPFFIIGIPIGVTSFVILIIALTVKKK